MQTKTQCVLEPCAVLPGGGEIFSDVIRVGVSNTSIENGLIIRNNYSDYFHLLFFAASK